MEIVSFNTKEKEIADAVKGYWGKEVGKDYKLVYFGQGVLGVGDKEILEKKCGVPHYEWEELTSNVYFAVVK